MLERLMPGHTQSMSTQRYGHTWEICEMSEAMPGASCNQSFPTNSTLQCPAKRCKKCLRRVTVMCAAHKVDATEICVKSFKSHFQNRSIVDHSLSHVKLKDLVPNCQKLPVTHSYQYSPLGHRMCYKQAGKKIMICTFQPRNGLTEQTHGGQNFSFASLAFLFSTFG